MVQESKFRSEVADLQIQLAEMTRQAEENKEHDAALDDLLKQKQQLLQERDNQVLLQHSREDNRSCHAKLKSWQGSCADQHLNLGRLACKLGQEMHKESY